MDFRRRRLLGLLGAGLGAGAVGLHATRPGRGSVTAPEQRPEATRSAVEEYVGGVTDFGFDLLAELAADPETGNVLFSPLSISTTLAMVWAGARGETADQMATALGYDLDREALHPAVGAVLHDLDERARTVPGRDVPAVWRTDRFELTVANAVWGQSGFGFREPYLRTLERHYGASLRRSDFATDPAAARREVNDWVAESTNGRIAELFPAGTIDDATRLVLANAVSLLADWARPFDPADTEDRPFTTLDGSTVDVPTMRQTERFPAVLGEDYRVVELPYVGESVSFVVVVPAEGTFESFERTVDGEWLASRFGELDETETTRVRVSLPRFEFEYATDLVPPLKALGMERAFDRTAADLTGIAPPSDGGDRLFVGDVRHDAHVAVDEVGTEAVAATGATVQFSSMPPSVDANRPFLFFVRDRPTDAVLFAGRVVDPNAAQE